jgi:hypothetical protein
MVECDRQFEFIKFYSHKKKVTILSLKITIIEVWEAVQLAQYIEVWEAVHSTNLVPELPDTIAWTLNANTTYNACSAYEAQFLGSHARFDAMKIWSAHAEPNGKLFGWLALHGKLLTADMLDIRGWPHDPRCPLCLSEPETVDHLCRNCPFTTAVWNLVVGW